MPRDPAVGFVDPGFGLSQRQEPRCDFLEQAVLGTIMLNSKVFFAVAEFLEDKHFYVTTHQELYRFLEGEISADRLITEQLLQVKLKGSGILKDVGGDDYIRALYAAVIDSTELTALPYAQAIVDTWKRRTAIEIGGNSIEGFFGADPTMDADAVITQQIEQLSEVMGVRTIGRGGASFDRAFDEAVEASEQIDRGKVAAGLPYGMERLEAMIGRLRNSWLYLLGGRPGQGKSALAKQLVLGVARELRREAETAPMFTGPPGVVLFFSLEMLRQQVATWMGCELAGIDNAAFSRPKTDAEANAIRLAQVEAKKLGVHIHIEDNEGSPLTIQQLAVIARGFRSRNLGPVRLIVVDHVQKLLKAEKNARDQTAATAKITSTLKDIARALGIPVIALAHLVKDVGRREDGSPQLEDLKYAGEEDADIVFFLSRPEVALGEAPPEAILGETDQRTNQRREGWYKRKAKWKDRALVSIGKRREGSGPKEIILGFRGETTSFYEIGTAPASHMVPPDDPVPF
jgi:replicative DNA helicase